VRLRDTGTAERTVLSVGAVSPDLRTRRATVGDATVGVTAREFTMLETFMRHPDQVLTREQLLSHVGATTTIPGRTSSTSTSATCAASSAPTRSSPDRCCRPGRLRHGGGRPGRHRRGHRRPAQRDRAIAAAKKTVPAGARAVKVERDRDTGDRKVYEVELRKSNTNYEVDLRPPLPRHRRRPRLRRGRLNYATARG
jgi:hypothetical protein